MKPNRAGVDMRVHMIRSAITSLAVFVVFSADVYAATTTAEMTNNNTNNANSTALTSAEYTNTFGGSVTQNFEASKMIPYLPGTISPAATAPTLFSLQGLPAQVSGIPLLTKNIVYASRHDVALGSSGGTKVIFNATYPVPRAENKERNVYVNLNGIAKGEVIGSITVQSRKNKADEVDFSTLVYDARQYIAGVAELNGYNVVLLTLRNSVSFSLGVDSRASGLSLSPLVSGLLNGPAGAMVGLSSGFSTNAGETAPIARIGCTFLVLVDSEKSQIVDVRRDYSVPEPASANGNGNNNKKYEAIQSKGG
ncbi:hypothetical protein, partial [Chlorobaculum sp. 24CR]|uniref:hypothetical protein n=1 Tax=Chlorobaculum sp. 24CR TaxID=2508878 RepID=UPI001ADCC4B9